MTASKPFKREYTPVKHSPIKTQKGTELPMMDMRGKPYLQVAHRLVWFREEHPDWRIKTSVQVGNKSCLANAEISDDKGNIISTAHKFETESGFPDYIEKAETGAVGRALAMIGYGTQFAPELDEGERPVDSPTAAAKTKSKASSMPSEMAEHLSRHPGDYVVKLGEFTGQQLKDIEVGQLQLYLENIINFKRKGKKAPPEGLELIEFAEIYLKTLKDKSA